MTTTFENAKVGDRVYALNRGVWTTIEEVNYNDKFPIITEIGNSYTLDGKYVDNGDQVLFWDKPEIIAPHKPRPEAPQIDTLVEVREGGKWVKRYSAGGLTINGHLFCFRHGASSLTTDGMEISWPEWRIYDPEQEKK